MAAKCSGMVSSMEMEVTADNKDEVSDMESLVCTDII